MPDKWPLANGNWSNAANWNGGTKPVAGDDVYADGKTVTIDEDITVASIRNTQRSGGTANGSFTLTTSRTINANIIAGNGNSQSCVYVNTTGISLTVNGNITAGSNSDAHGIYIDNLAILNVNGNIFGGTGGIRPVGVFVVRQTNINVVGNVTAGSSSNAHAIQSNGNNTSTITVTGAVTGGSGGTATGIRNEGNVTIIVNGNVNGGSGASGIGINNVTTGLVTVNGNVTGGAGSNSFGVNNGATGTVLITGNATGGEGSTAYGANNTSTGLLRVYGSAIGNDYGLGYSTNNGTPGVFGFGTNAGAIQATTTVRSIRYGAKGQSPTAGLVQLDITSLANSSARFRTEPNSFTEYTFGPPENIGGQPTPSDVRLGVVYNFGNRTGTCAVPGAASVVVGVPVDNTVGTAAITAATIRSALGMASANLDTQLAGISSKTNQLTFTSPGQVDANAVTGGLTQAQVRGAIGLAAANLDTQLAGLADDIGNIEVDNAAIATAVQSQLDDDFSTLAVAIAGIDPAAVTIVPLSATRPTKVKGSNIETYTGDTDPIRIAIWSGASGTTPVDLEAMRPLTLVIADKTSKEIIQEVADADLDIDSTNYLTFTPSFLAVESEAIHRWSLRKANGAVLGRGDFQVFWEPEAEAE